MPRQHYIMVFIVFYSTDIEYVFDSFGCLFMYLIVLVLVKK